MNGVSVTAIVVSLASALLGGGLIGVWFKYLIDKGRLTKDERSEAREESRLDFKMILDVVTGQRDEAFAKLDQTEEKFERVELEVQGLRLAKDLDPFPNWIVDLEGRYIFVNREFEKEFLEPREHNYRWAIGRRHDEVWSAEFAAKMRTLDESARRRPDRRARATMGVGDRQLTVHKFAICMRGVPVAWAGYVTEIE